MPAPFSPPFLQLPFSHPPLSPFPSIQFFQCLTPCLILHSSVNYFVGLLVFCSFQAPFFLHSCVYIIDIYSPPPTVI